jgi:hypothetical protein
LLEDLIKYEEFGLSEAAMEELIRDGVLIVQYLDGIKYVRISSEMKNAYIGAVIEEPEEYCAFLWNDLVSSSADLTTTEFLTIFCGMHSQLKSMSGGDIDFAEIIGSILMRK